MQRTKDAFSAYNPIINFIFYFGAFVFGMLFVHPAFVLIAVIFSAAYFLNVSGMGGWKYVAGILPLLMGIAVLNPVFNTRGETVLFAYLDGRNYTLEALYYGISLSGLFAAVVWWFASYNVVMTSDKFMYLFGKWIPSLSLVLTMTLRLVPNYQKKLQQIRNARRCIGKSGAGQNRKKQIKNGITILSAMTDWAFEGGIITSDSMRCRGYGVGNRTSFSVYRFGGRDKLLLFTMLGLLVGILYCGIRGGMAVTYLPKLEVAGNGYTLVGACCYGMFLSIPTIINLMEEWKWHILRSRI